MPRDLSRENGDWGTIGHGKLLLVIEVIDRWGGGASKFIEVLAALNIPSLSEYS